MKLAEFIEELVSDPYLSKTKSGRVRKCKKFLYRCFCGKLFTSQLNPINDIKAVSCGCVPKKHGKSYTSEHRTWTQMKQRCYNPNNKSYKDYGKRGIEICDRWMDKENGFINFYNDMGPKPNVNYSIDRIDNNAGYHPDNCRWATIDEQAINKRDVIWITYNNETRTLSQWSKITGISRDLLHHRFTNHKSVEEIFEPVNKNKKFNNVKVIYLNKEYLLYELCQQFNLHLKTVRRRLNKGWDLEKAMFTPIDYSKINNLHKARIEKAKEELL